MPLQLLTQVLNALFNRGREDDPEADARIASVTKARIAVAALPLGLALVARGLYALERLIGQRVGQLAALEHELGVMTAGRTQAAEAAFDDGPVENEHPDPWANIPAVRACELSCQRDPGHLGECVMPEPDKVSVADEVAPVVCKASPGCVIPFPHEHAAPNGEAFTFGGDGVGKLVGK